MDIYSVSLLAGHSDISFKVSYAHANESLYLAMLLQGSASVMTPHTTIQPTSVLEGMKN